MNVDYATGEIVESLTRAEAERTTSTFMASFIDALVGKEREVDIFEGLEPKMVSYLEAALADNPGLRPTLVKAARIRQASNRQVKTPARFVYFIQSADGPIKIGSASDVNARLGSLQTGSPEKLTLLGAIEGGEARERELHQQFAATRLRGEWFAPSAALLRLIGDAS